MFEIIDFKKESGFPNGLTRDEFVDFMHEHLDKFRDPKEAISKCLDYAFSDEPGLGGFCLAGFDDGKLIGGVIMNKTGMSGYIPENILVYVAVDRSTRGKGYGGQLCKRAIELSEGDVKLHVEYDNPAKRLYERLGFTNKYAEMRFNK